MSELAAQISTSIIIAFLNIITNRDWEGFKKLEREFANEHGVDVWEDVFNFRIKPAVDKDSDRWLLVQWCSQGIKSHSFFDENGVKTDTIYYD